MMSGPIFLLLRVLIAAALFAFLGWALFTLWRDLKRQEEMLAVRQASPLTLILEDTGQSFHFQKPLVRIGRDLSCDCCLEDKTVSTQHARLSFHHNQWWLEDLGSTNGTFLNQEAVTSPVVVTRGDQFRVGQVRLKIVVN
jgi:pSer/pThr/pTyr-binding forkhead associated (FHA) protein